MIKRFGDIATVLTLLPLLIVMAVLVGLYYMVRFPLWWLQRAFKTRKRWFKWHDVDIV